MRVSSMKNIVLIRPLSTVHPNIVIPPGFACKYITAFPSNCQTMRFSYNVKRTHGKTPRACKNVAIWKAQLRMSVLLVI